jgi:hypothetical protein
MLKNLLRISGITILILLLAMFILPFVFKDKIMNLVKEEANKNLNATLNFSDLDLSFFRSFPFLSIGIDSISLVGQDDFKGDTLISASSIRMSTGLMSIIRGSEIDIRSLEIKDAGILLKVLNNGKTNWDITKPSPPTGEPEKPSAFKAGLKYYKIENSRIVYDDRASDMLVKMDKINHEGSGDFTADFTNLETETTIEAFSYIYGGIPYLYKARLGYKAGFGLDLKNSVYEFKENELSLNDLHLKFIGTIAMPANDITMDIKYEALKNDVRSFFSLVPGAYSDNFSDVKSAGKLAFNGFVKGTYNEKSIPGFAFNLLIENGMIQYPSLPGAISNLQVKTSITNPGGDADKTVIDVSRFHADLAGIPFDAKLLVRSPVSDPDLDASLKGRIDLAKVKDFMPLEKNTRIGGIVDANVSFKGRLSSIELEKYQQFQASGNVSLNNFIYSDPAIPQEVKISSALLDFNPKAIQLSRFNMMLGKSDLSASGSLENYLAYIFSDKNISGNLVLNSNLLDLNPFLSETQTATTGTTPTADTEGYIRIPDNIGFKLQANIGTLLYDNMKLTNMKGTLSAEDQMLRMSEVFMNALGGSILLNGTYDTRSNEGPVVDLALQIKDMIIRDAAKTFNTVKQLAPVAENTTGTASVKMNFTSKADKQFNLIYPSLNGSGTISTSTITIEGFEMVKRMAASLKIDKLKKWQMEKFSAGFAIREGKLIVEPFDTKIGNYAAKIAGSNGLDQSIEYIVNVEIPRSEFGGAANSVLNNLTARANAGGLKGGLGDMIPVAVKITGTFNDPKISTDIRQQTNDAMMDLKKQAQEKLKEEADRKKKELEERANTEKEKLMQQAEKEKERLRQEAEKAKKEAERKLNEEKEKARKKAEEEAKKNLNKLLKRP